MPEVAKLSKDELRELVRDCDLYERLLQGKSPPLRCDIDEVVATMIERFWKDWKHAVDKIEALAEDLDLRGWHQSAAYTRLHVKRMESER